MRTARVGQASLVKARAEASMVIAPRQVPMGFTVSPLVPVVLVWVGLDDLGGLLF